jgi:hypothetical protein
MIATAAMAGAAAAFPALRRPALPSPFRSSAKGAEARPTDLRTLAEFAPHVGSRFALDAAGTPPIDVTLEEAAASAAHPAGKRRLRGEAFSLLFRGPAQPAATDGTHTMSHPALGTFPLFLVAVGRGSNAQEYQAVVDRRMPPR